MSPELQFLLTTMHTDIRAIAERVGGIEEKIATGQGAADTRVRIVKAAQWIAMLIAAAFAGHVGAAGH